MELIAPTTKEHEATGNKSRRRTVAQIESQLAP